jgi:hypothetical protein
MDEPTMMSQNILRARVFQLLNLHYHGDDNCNNPTASPYGRIRNIDEKIDHLLQSLPWYFQLNDQGQPMQLPEAVHEVVTWQHHIIRTCICTQRIRMYRPFLGAGIDGARDTCVKAAVDAVSVYKALRQDISEAFWLKFLPQAYQIFSVAVTVAALFLVEGNLEVPDLYESMKDMVMDLQVVERRGCQVPVTIQGRKILLRMMSLIDTRNRSVPSPEEAHSLVPQISVVMGGERTTREYMNRLGDAPANNEMVTPASTGPPDHDHWQDAQGNVEAGTSSTRRDSDELDNSWMTPLLDLSFSDMEMGFDSGGMVEAPSNMALFNWDMTGFLINAQHGEQ